MLISKILSLAKLDNQKRIIMNRNAMLQKNYIKQTWRIISNVINTKKCKLENIVTKIIQDDVVHWDSRDIANMFNDYFVDIGKDIAESIGGEIITINFTTMIYVSQPYSFFIQINSLLFHWKNSLLSEVWIQQYEYNSCKKEFKSFCDIISSMNIINESLTTGVLPDSLKKSHVTPVTKEGDECNLCTYRPISVLPVFSKIFEKVAYDL